MKTPFDRATLTAINLAYVFTERVAAYSWLVQAMLATAIRRNGGKVEDLAEWHVVSGYES